MDFLESPQYKFLTNPSSGSYADTCGQMDVMKKLGTFCNFANAPKKQ